MSTVGDEPTSKVHIYGSAETLEGEEEREDHAPVSDRVHTLANSIYQEFESMIGKYGDGVVENLMPLIVGMLEGMDKLYADRHNLEIELELIKEDKNQVVLQYDREKGMRKMAEEKILKFEDDQEEENKQFENKIESLESLVRIMELKARNAHDHSLRLEEKESEQKKEFCQLHERYTELLRSHMDYIERTKSALQLQNQCEGGQPPGVLRTGVVQGEDKKEVLMDKLDNWDVPTEPASSPGDGVEPLDDFDVTTMPNVNTSFQEESGEFDDFLTNGDDETSLDEFGDQASWGNPSDFGMGHEIEILIKENSELIETKHALNIVKDDLIIKVDDLTGENMMLREELNSVNMSKAKLKEQLSETEKEKKELKEQTEKMRIRLAEIDDEEEEDTGDSTGLEVAIMKTRFTRREMSRVLHERNLYKERLMELQEAVRWTEKMRNEKREKEKEREDEGLLTDLSIGLQSWITGPERPVVVSTGSSARQETVERVREDTSSDYYGVRDSQKQSSIWNFFSKVITTAANTFVDDQTPLEASLLHPPPSRIRPAIVSLPKPGSAQRLDTLVANQKKGHTTTTNPLLSIGKDQSELSTLTPATVVQLVPCEVTLLPVTSQPTSPE